MELSIHNIKGIKDFVVKQNIQANRPNIFEWLSYREMIIHTIIINSI